MSAPASGWVLVHPPLNMHVTFCPDVSKIPTMSHMCHSHRPLSAPDGVPCFCPFGILVFLFWTNLQLPVSLWKNAVCGYLSSWSEG